MATRPNFARAASAMRGLWRRRPATSASPDPADLGTAFGMEAMLEATPESLWPAPVSADTPRRRHGDRPAASQRASKPPRRR